MKTALPLLFLIGAFGCADILDIPDTSEVDFGGLFDEGKVIDVPKPIDDGPEVVVVDNDQCTLSWEQTRPSGGVASHPAVEADGVITVTAGSQMWRYDSTGSSTVICPAPFEAAGENFGTPSVDGDGATYIGTKTGKVFAVTRKCLPKTKWSAPAKLAGKDGAACKHNPDNPVLCDGEVFGISSAPVLTSKHLWVLDDRPTLHKITKAEGAYLANFITVDEPLPGAAAVFVDTGASRFIAFPTKHSVIARQETAGPAFTFDAFEDTGREVTTPLAVTKDGKLVFVGGKPEGSAHIEIALYRLKAEPDGKKAVIDDGFPKAIDLPLDTIHGIVIGADESVYAATESHGLVKYDSEGVEQWRFIGDNVSLRLSSVPALANNNVFITAEPNLVYGVDLDGNRIFERESSNAQTTSPAITEDGTVIVHYGTKILALKCKGTTGLADSGWPRYQRNNRNTGNILEVQ